jgi:hypothetical protein
VVLTPLWHQRERNTVQHAASRRRENRLDMPSSLPTGDTSRPSSRPASFGEVATPGDAPEPDTEIVVIPNAVRIANVALRGRAATSQGQQQVTAALERVPHIARVLNQTDLKGLRAGEKHDGLVVEAEEPWGFVPPAGPGGGTQGAHGSTEEMRVPLLLSGTGIRRRAAPRDARLVDVAPTICALLGVRSPADAQGRLLSESTGF